MTEMPVPAGQAARARRYQTRRLLLAVSSDVVGFAVLAAFFVLAPRAGWPAPGGPAWWAGGMYFGIVQILRSLASAPLDYLGEFRLAHAFGLSNETRGGWVRDRLKGLVLQLILGGAVAGGLLSLIAVRRQGWWWMAGLGGGVLGALLALAGSVLLAPLFFRFKPLSDPALRDRLEGLLRRTGSRVHGGVWEMDLSRRTKAANAALVGWGPSRRVVLADNLLSRYAPEEVEAVLAHELAHHKGRHIPRLLLGRTLALLSGLWIAEALLARPAWLAGAGIALSSAAEPAAIGFLWMVLSVWGFVTAPLFLAYSRRLERGCDAFAVRHTGGPEGMASVLVKLCRDNLSDPRPPRWVVWLFHSHPPPADRFRWIHEEGAREGAAGFRGAARQGGTQEGESRGAPRRGKGGEDSGRPASSGEC